MTDYAMQGCGVCLKLVVESADVGTDSDSGLELEKQLRRSKGNERKLCEIKNVHLPINEVFLLHTLFSNYEPVSVESESAPPWFSRQKFYGLRSRDCVSDVYTMEV